MRFLARHLGRGPGPTARVSDAEGLPLDDEVEGAEDVAKLVANQLRNNVDRVAANDHEALGDLVVVLHAIAHKELTEVSRQDPVGPP